MAKKETKKQEKKQKKIQEKEDTKKKKGKSKSSDAKKSKKDAKGTGINDVTLDRSKMTADQMTQAQIEEAIKESQDPSSRLTKLRSPLSVRGCLLNILILVALTVAIVILCCYLMLDKGTFNLGVVLKDMLQKLPTEKHSVWWFFKLIITKIKGIFK